MTVFDSQFDTPPPPDLIDPDPVVRRLVQSGQVSAQVALLARAIADAEALPVADVLRTRFSVSPRNLLLAARDDLASCLVDPTVERPDPALVARYGVARAMTTGVLPWRRAGTCTLVLAPSYDVFQRHRAALEDAIGPVRLALSTIDQITAVLARDFGKNLVVRAETRLPAGHSSRGWRAGRTMAATCAAGLALLTATLIAPVAVLTILCAVAVALLALSSLIKGAAALAGRRPPPPRQRRRRRPCRSSRC